MFESERSRFSIIVVLICIERHVKNVWNFINGVFIYQLLIESLSYFLIIVLF